MAPALMEELVEEILLRLPPGDPGSLIRASLVCKPWGRLPQIPPPVPRLPPDTPRAGRPLPVPPRLRRHLRSHLLCLLPPSLCPPPPQVLRHGRPPRPRPILRSRRGPHRAQSHHRREAEASHAAMPWIRSAAYVGWNAAVCCAEPGCSERMGAERSR
ncbi:unnamed protein product [Urochloa humidicola]